MLAIPGETTCRAVAPCGSPPWGDIPIDAGTRFVDAAYPGGDGDGSEARPFATLEEAFIAAAPGALIALAAGSYQAYFDFQLKPVRVWGRCPELVEIVGPDPAFASVIIGSEGASGTEFHTLAVRGEGPGVLAFAARDVLLDRLWVHDTGRTGISAQHYPGPAEMVVQGSLVERAHLQGMYVDGSELLVSDSVVRDTQPSPEGAQGYGFFAIAGIDGSASRLEVTGALIERNRTIGVLASGGDAVLDGVLVRDTAPHQIAQLEGYGVVAQTDPISGRRGNLVLRSSNLERNQEAGAFAASGDLTIEWSRIRDTMPRMDGQLGRGATAEVLPGVGTPSQLTVRESTLDHNADIGILVWGSLASVERVAVLDTVPDNVGKFGDGVAVYTSAQGHGGELAVTQSRIARSARAGASSFASLLRLGSSLLQCNLIQLNGEAVHTTPFGFDDLGGNRCECGNAVEQCHVVSSNLTPPSSASIE